MLLHFQVAAERNWRKQCGKDSKDKISLECGQARRSGTGAKFSSLASEDMLSLGFSEARFYQTRGDRNLWDMAARRKGEDDMFGMQLSKGGAGIHPMSPQWTIGCLSDAEFHRAWLLTSSLAVAF